MKREDALKKWLPIVKMGVESMPELEDAVNIAISDVEKMKKIEHIVKAEIPYKLVEIEKVIADRSEEDGNE